MTESHEHLLLSFDILDELVNLVNTANLFEHLENSLVGSSVSGTVEGGYRSTNRCIDISDG